MSPYLVKGYHYSIMFAKNPFIHFKRFFRKKIARGIERRRSIRVQFEQPVRCRVEDLQLEQPFDGYIEDISLGGVRLLLSREVPKGHVLRVSFIDEVTKKKISIYVDPCPMGRNRSVDDDKPHLIFEYRCPIHSDLDISPDYKKYYLRILSDMYVKTLYGNRSYRARTVNDRRNNKRNQCRVIFKTAETVYEREAAYRLAYREYARRDLILENSYKMYLYRYLLLPTTTTFLGLLNGEVVMTMTAVMDSKWKLPMNEIFGDVLEPLREDHRRLVEFGILAVKKELYGKQAYSLEHFRKMNHLFSLFRLAMQHSVHYHGATDIVIAIPPYYQKLYHYLCFDSLTELRHYGKYKTPALAMRLDLIRVRNVEYMRELSRVCLMNYFFHKKVIFGDISETAQLSPKDIQYLFAEKSDFIKQLNSPEWAVLEECYPEIYAKMKESIKKIKPKTAAREDFDEAA